MVTEIKPAKATQIEETPRRTGSCRYELKLVTVIGATSPEEAKQQYLSFIANGLIDFNKVNIREL